MESEPESVPTIGSIKDLGANTSREEIESDDYGTVDTQDTFHSFYHEHMESAPLIEPAHEIRPLSAPLCKSYTSIESSIEPSVHGALSRPSISAVPSQAHLLNNNITEYDLIIERKEVETGSFAPLFERRKNFIPEYGLPPVLVHRSLSVNPAFLAIATKKPEKICQILDVLRLRRSEKRLFFRVLAQLERASVGQQLVTVPSAVEAQDMYSLERARVGLMDEYTNLCNTKRRVHAQLFEMNRRVRDLEDENRHLRRELDAKKTRVEHCQKELSEAKARARSVKKAQSHLKRVHTSDIDFWKKEALEKSSLTAKIDGLATKLASCERENEKLRRMGTGRVQHLEKELTETQARLHVAVTGGQKKANALMSTEKSLRLEITRLKQQVEVLKGREADALTMVENLRDKQTKQTAAIARLKTQLDELGGVEKRHSQLEADYKALGARESEVSNAFEQLVAANKRVQQSLIDARNVTSHYESRIQDACQGLEVFVEHVNDSEELDLNILLKIAQELRR
eukprot:Rmarinus@m.6258